MIQGLLNMGLFSLLIHVLICFIIFVDKSIDLELVMFTRMILYRVFILYKLTRPFWANTCLVSMCITGARGAANKQVRELGLATGFTNWRPVL